MSGQTVVGLIIHSHRNYKVYSVTIRGCGNIHNEIRIDLREDLNLGIVQLSKCDRQGGVLRKKADQLQW